jgi:hypothetical protein
LEKDLFQRLDLILWDCQERMLAMKDWSRYDKKILIWAIVMNEFHIIYISPI